MILFLIAYILLLPLTIFNWFIVHSKGYFRDTALSMDIFANREFRATWNLLLRKDTGYEFGKPGETISSVLGKNQRDSNFIKTHEFKLYYVMRIIKTFKYPCYSNLTRTGNLLCNILDSIDKEHCKNSINLEI